MYQAVQQQQQCGNVGAAAACPSSQAFCPLLLHCYTHTLVTTSATYHALPHSHTLSSLLFAAPWFSHSAHITYINPFVPSPLPILPRAHRGLRHYWGLRVKGQHTKTTGRRGKTVGVAKKR